MKPLPLAGIRVLDLTQIYQGPYATFMMAMGGAEVIKIEPPGGEELRFIGPKGSDGLSLYYRAINAGKAMTELDLRSEEGRGRLLSYVETADVLVESFRPGVMQRLGVGIETLKAAKPDLIVCAMSGFGQNGPFVRRAGHDMNYLALNGVLSLAAGSAPPYPPPADVSAAQTAVIALLGALRHRDRTGEGSEIDLALADTPLPLATFDLAEVSVNPELGSGEGVINGAAAYCQIYETGDGGRITLCPIEPKFWQAFCEAAERPDWLERHGDPLPQNALRAEIAAYFADLSLEEAVSRFEPADCCFAPVLSLSQALESEQLAARGLVRRGEDGVWQALFPARVDGEAPRLRTPLRKL